MSILYLCAGCGGGNDRGLYKLHVSVSLYPILGERLSLTLTKSQTIIADQNFVFGTQIVEYHAPWLVTEFMNIL